MIKLNKKWELIAWSYLGGAVSTVGSYAVAYVWKIVNGEVHVWNWKLVGLLAVGATLAPVFRAINPKLNEFGLLDLLKPFEKKAVDVVTAQVATVSATPVATSSNTPTA